MSGAAFNTITGADWTRSLRASRARRTRHVLEVADIRRRASEATAARNNSGKTPEQKNTHDKNHQ